jgi:iron transport multicopper oxidase
MFILCQICSSAQSLIGNVLCFAGKTYRFRVHNVGTSTSLNFRIQGHNLLLVETEGHYTVQQNFSSFDIHVGQSCSFLVTMDQNATSDYYIVASARFVNESLWQKVTGVGILQYSNSKGSATGPLPEAPSDIYNQWSAMNQPKAIRLFLSLKRSISSIIFPYVIASQLCHF